MERSDLVGAAKRKGFAERKPPGTNHDIYTLRVDGLETNIILLVSRGTGHRTLSKKMVGKIKRELSFQTQEQFKQFVTCTFSEKDYVEMLRRTGKLNSH